MNRIDRLNAILIHLQGKPRVPIEELEERFELSRRTIFRDIRALLESGVPIGGNAGEGYFIVEGYHLPPVVFNKNEAAGLLLGAKFIERHADTATIATLDSAMRKVKAVLRYSDKEFLDNLESRVTVRPNPQGEKVPDSHIVELQSAVAMHRIIRIAYHSGLDQTTQREVEPLGMVFYSSHWHLIGYCRLRGDLRDFRADRIQQIEVTNASFDPDAHPDFKQFLNDSLTGTDAKEAVIRVTQRMSRFMGEQKYFQGFVQQQRVGDFVEMKFVVAYPEYFVRWLLMYGNEIQIQSPPEFKEIAVRIIGELAEHYEATVLSK